MTPETNHETGPEGCVTTPEALTTTQPEREVRLWLKAILPFRQPRGCPESCPVSSCARARADIDPGAHSAPEQIVKAAKIILARRCVRGTKFTTPNAAADYLVTHYSDKPSEVFVCLFQDNNHRLIAAEEMFHGTVDGEHVYPREIARRCLELNAPPSSWRITTRQGFPSQAIRISAFQNESGCPLT
jgi:hypothetical protein